MAKGSRWSARITLLITILMFGAVMGAFDALGQTGGVVPVAIQTGASPSASSSAKPSASPSASSSPCRIPSPLPAPPQVCPSSSGGSSASPTGSASPGGGETHKSTISLTYNRTKFTGTVQSDPKCESKRNVVVRRVKKGPDPLVGKDTTDSKGKYSVAEPNAKGKFYAKVLKRVFTQGDTTITCGGAKSKVLKVG